MQDQDEVNCMLKRAFSEKLKIATLLITETDEFKNDNSRRSARIVKTECKLAGTPRESNNISAF